MSLSSNVGASCFKIPRFFFLIVMAIFPNTCDFCIKFIPHRLELTAVGSNHFAFKPVSETVNVNNMGNSCYCSILLPAFFLNYYYQQKGVTSHGLCPAM